LFLPSLQCHSDMKRSTLKLSVFSENRSYLLRRLVWLVLPVALMLILVFAARYLIEHTDGPLHERLLRPPQVASNQTSASVLEDDPLHCRALGPFL
jgi:hypothetical protein